MAKNKGRKSSCLILDIKIYIYTEDIQFCVDKIQIGPGGNPGDATLRQCARTEVGSWPFFYLKLFYIVESFYCPNHILHTPTECVQPRWPLYVSARGCTFFLQLFTRLEDKHCTLYALEYKLYAEEKTNQETNNKYWTILPRAPIAVLKPWPTLPPGSPSSSSPPPPSRPPAAPGRTPAGPWITVTRG